MEAGGLTAIIAAATGLGAFILGNVPVLVRDEDGREIAAPGATRDDAIRDAHPRAEENWETLRFPPRCSAPQCCKKRSVSR